MVGNDKPSTQTELTLVRSGMIVLITLLPASSNRKQIMSTKLKCCIIVAEDTTMDAISSESVWTCEIHKVKSEIYYS